MRCLVTLTLRLRPLPRPPTEVGSSSQVQVRRVHRTHPPFRWFVFFETDATAPPPKATTTAGAVFSCVSHFSHTTFSLCQLKAGAEPTLSWQQLTHIRPGQAALADETLEVFHVHYRRFPFLSPEAHHPHV